MKQLVASKNGNNSESCPCYVIPRMFLVLHTDGSQTSPAHFSHSEEGGKGYSEAVLKKELGRLCT